MTTINSVGNNLSGATGTGNFVGSNSPTLVTPALGTPSAVNLSNATALTAAALPPGTLFNFQQAQLTTPVSTSSATFSTITGLSVSITPTSASSTVLVRAVINFGQGSTNQGYFQLVRGATPIGVGTTVGSRKAVGASSANMSGNGSLMCGTVVMEWLDNPATTSATTYSAQFAVANADTINVNASTTDTNSANFPRASSVISVCEVHA